MLLQMTAPYLAAAVAERYEGCDSVTLLPFALHMLCCTYVTQQLLHEVYNCNSYCSCCYCCCRAACCCTGTAAELPAASFHNCQLLQPCRDAACAQLLTHAVPRCMHNTYQRPHAFCTCSIHQYQTWVAAGRLGYTTLSAVCCCAFGTTVSCC